MKLHKDLIRAPEEKPNSNKKFNNPLIKQMIMQLIANKTIEKLRNAKDNFSQAVAIEEGSRNNAIKNAQEYLATLNGYLGAMQQRMGAKIKDMHVLKKALLAKQGRIETSKLPVFQTGMQTRAVSAAAANPATAKNKFFPEQEQIMKEISVFKRLLNQAKEHLIQYNMAMANYLLKIGNKYKFLIIAGEDAVRIPEIKKQVSRDIIDELSNLQARWDYFTSLENDLMETTNAWLNASSKKEPRLISDCEEALAEFKAFTKNAKGKTDKLSKHLNLQCTTHFVILMKVVYDLFKEAKIY